MMKINKKTAYTLVEMLIALSIFSIVSIGVLKATINLGKNFQKSRDSITARQQIGNLIQTVKSFLCKSKSVEFRNASGNKINMNQETANVSDLNVLDTLFVIKRNVLYNTALVGKLVYDQGNHTIRWYQDADQNNSVVILRDVYRTDYSIQNEGVKPIFRFPPPNNTFYDSNNNPNLVAFDFNKLLATPNSTNPEPEFLTVTFFSQVNTLGEMSEIPTTSSN